MRHCPKCGFALVENLATCPRCGLIFSKYKRRLAQEQQARSDPLHGAPAENTSSFKQESQKRPRRIRQRLFAEIGVGLFLLVITVAFSQYLKERPLSLTKAVTIVRPALATVRVFGKNGSLPFTEVNGFFFDDNPHLVVCSNSLRNASFVEIKNFDGRVYNANIVAFQDNETGLLKLTLDPRPKLARCIDQEKNVPEVGEKVFFLDCCSGKRHTIFQTNISAINQVPEFGTVFDLAIPLSEKMAGIPVFNSRAKLVGVITTIKSEKESQTIIVSSETLASLNEKAVGTSMNDWLAANAVREGHDNAATWENNVADEGGLSSEESGPTVGVSPPTHHEEPKTVTAQGNSSSHSDLSTDIVEEVCKATVMVKTPFSIGAGFFVTKTGFILTNRHVVEGADTLSLSLDEQVRKIRSSLEQGTSLMKQMEVELENYAQNLNQLQQELDRLKWWLRDTEQRMRGASESFYYHLKGTYDQKVKEYNFLANRHNSILKDYKARLREYETIKSKVESLRDQVREKDDQLSKVRYQDPFRIVLSDGTEYRVFKIAISSKHDLALLKLDGCTVPCVEIGNPREVNRGSKVYAIGSPLGLSHSVTSGVFSAHRGELLQTSAQINKGNSGGPLLTENGQVIGINTLKLVGEGVEGISFAIPIDVALSEFSSYIK